MAFQHTYDEHQPLRSDIDASMGATVLEFGTDWCGFCQAAQPMLREVLETRVGVRHLKVEDGPGRTLGRSFRIKLWPTLVFLRDGTEVARIVRPQDRDEVEQALHAI